MKVNFIVETPKANVQHVGRWQYLRRLKAALQAGFPNEDLILIHEPLSEDQEYFVAVFRNPRLGNVPDQYGRLKARLVSCL